MKFKFYHLLIIYELATFVHEMYKRKARSIRFELQESVGKVNIYIDDSSFKQLDGSIAWRMVKSMYDYIAKRDKDKPEDFDKDKDFEGVLDQSDFNNLNSKYKINFLPLPKGKCLTYSYTKKSGNIYEVAFSLTSNNIEDLIYEKINEKQDFIKQDIPLYFDDEQTSETYEVDAISFKGEKIKLILTLDEDDIIKSFKIEDFNGKSDVKKFFDSIYFKESDVTTKKVDTKEEVVETQNEKPDVKKITW